MSQFLQLLGTFASIISVPLAIIFYLKTKDGKYEKIRKELGNLFTSYIGAGNSLSTFHLSSVINAKLRENNLKSGRITIKSVIEDLVIEIISNPLLNKGDKATILNNLEQLMFDAYSENLIEKKNLPPKDSDDKAEQHNKNAKKKNLVKRIFLHKSKGSVANINLITLFVSIVSIILTLLISSGQVTEIFEVIDLTNTSSQILAGIITLIISVLSTYLIDRINTKE